MMKAFYDSCALLINTYNIGKNSYKKRGKSHLDPSKFTIVVAVFITIPITKKTTSFRLLALTDSY